MLSKISINLITEYFFRFSTNLPHSNRQLFHTRIRQWHLQLLTNLGLIPWITVKWVCNFEKQKLGKKELKTKKHNFYAWGHILQSCETIAVWQVIYTDTYFLDFLKETSGELCMKHTLLVPNWIYLQWHCTKNEVFSSRFLQQMWPNPQFPAGLVTFTEKILNGNLHFLCSVEAIKFDIIDVGQGPKYALGKQKFPLLDFDLSNCIKLEIWQIVWILLFGKNTKVSIWFPNSSPYFL